MTEFEQKVLADLSVLKSQMSALLGNGQPGRLRELEKKVDQHESVLQRAGGIGAFLAALVTLVHLGMDYFRVK
jgi:hypothetical protein